MVVKKRASSDPYTDRERKDSLAILMRNVAGTASIIQKISDTGNDINSFDKVLVSLRL